MVHLADIWSLREGQLVNTSILNLTLITFRDALLALTIVSLADRVALHTFSALDAL